MANETAALDVISMAFAAGSGNVGDAVGIDPDARNRPMAATNNLRVIGKLVTIDKDRGECGVQHQGVIRFKVDNNDTLGLASLGKSIIGKTGGLVQVFTPGASSNGNPTDAELALIENARGTIVDYSNESGNKWVDVIFP